MIWLVLCGVCAICLLPLLIQLRRDRGPIRDRRATALALYRAQWAELDRERAEGRLMPPEYDAALLDVQRRLLAEDAAYQPDLAAGDRGPIWLALALIPLVAFGLYLLQGSPGLPDERTTPAAEALP